MPPHHPTHEGEMRVFHANEHHVIIEIAKHVASPLTAALMIFAVHKTWQLPIIAGFFRGKYYTWAVIVEFSFA